MVSEVLNQALLKAVILCRFLQQGWRNGLRPAQASTLAEAFPSAAEALPGCPRAEHRRAAPSPGTACKRLCRVFPAASGSQPRSAFPLIRREWGQLERGSPYAWHQTLPVRSAAHSGTRPLSSLLSLLGPDRPPAAQGQGLLLAACEARITAVPQLGSCPLQGTAVHGHA